MFTEQITVEEIFGEDLDREVEVRGQCMRFLIEDGETVIVRRTKPEMLLIGDIILFQKDNQFVIHRIIYKRRTNGQYTYFTKGDVHPSFDPPVRAEQIIGKVVTIKKPIGPISLITPTGKMLNYSTAIYSLLTYLVTKLLESILNLPLQIISLSHQLVSQLTRINPNFFSFLNQCLNQFAGTIFSIAHQKKNACSRVFEIIPKFFFSFLTYYFTSKSVNELRKGTVSLFNSEVSVPQQILWSNLGLNELEKNLVEKYFTPGKKVLVTGCSAGRESFALAEKGFQVTGIDFADEIVKKATELNQKKKIPIEFRVMDAENLQFESNSFDYVVMFNMLYFFRREERVKILKEAHRVVGDGGKLLFWLYHESGYTFYLFLRRQGIFLPKWMAMLIDSFVTIFFDLPKTFLGLNLRDRYMVKVLVHCYSKKELAKEIQLAGWEIIEIGRKPVSLSGFDTLTGRVKLDYCVAIKSEN